MWTIRLEIGPRLVRFRVLKLVVTLLGDLTVQLTGVVKRPWISIFPPQAQVLGAKEMGVADNDDDGRETDEEQVRGEENGYSVRRLDEDVAAMSGAGD